MLETREAVLGVDIGTSSAKGVLVALDGTILRTATREHTVERPAPGHVEMDAHVWWEEFVGISSELVSGTDVHVAGIGVSGMGPCVLLADDAGEPVRPAILYGVDSRAEQQIEDLTARFGEDEILDRCGSVLSSQAAGPKIRWIADHEPEAFARATRLFMPASYLGFRLTGQYALDHASASMVTPAYDSATLDWHRPWAEHVAPGLELPPVLWSGEVMGTVSEAAAQSLSGIEAGTPVVAGSTDAWAEAISVGATAPGDVMLMYGTTTFLVAITDQPAPSRSLWVTSGTSQGTFTLSGGMAASGAITGWMRDLTGGADFATLVREADAAGVGANGLLMLPYFAGERSPMHDPSARGVIAGLTLSHTRGDLYRAALEAAAYGVRHHIEELRAAGVRIERVVAVGGGTQNALWPQIVSDVTGLRQEIPCRTVGASYGTSMLAARAAHGIETDGWNAIDRACEPDPAATARYDDLYRMYRELYPATRDIAHSLAALQRDG
ncbi:FGGY-family carbohydrate kinase [Brachybacterium alimentarium]|uniref:FGGY-family carbohydrate kinase n=1 Tax=Brachybacterium alimentarium TaxID=47845 RepID=UPI000DF13ED2|nr:FGGY-family carbohydrate kinase [Brachybacterium alimentarium]RCS79377.1 sugar kinase [Brachybacterium alimentarium]